MAAVVVLSMDESMIDAIGKSSMAVRYPRAGGDISHPPFPKSGVPFIIPSVRMRVIGYFRAGQPLVFPGRRLCTTYLLRTEALGFLIYVKHELCLRLK